MPETLLTIVFRGLMVFRKQGTGPGSYFEVGIHSHTDPKEHFLRINTITNGIISDSTPLDEDIATTERRWNLTVEGAVGNGVKMSPHTTSSFNRKDDQNTEDEDFAWIMDLESDEFFGPLDGLIHTSILKPVIRIPNGRFYTRMKSRRVRRTKDGMTVDEDFGRIGGAVACDIRLTGQSASLWPEGSVNPLFEFQAAPNTIYEIAYVPPDWPVLPSADHFHHYYHHLLDSSLPVFSFVIPSPTDAPSPALCGEVFLGVRGSDL